jgi:nucleoside-diphosphate-sugar epimerase
MKVLVTGATGVVAQAAVTELLKRGRPVRLLTGDAEHDSRQWVEGVETWPASICDASELRGCAEGCDLVLHVAGIVEEALPDSTFEAVNVEGTRSIVREAERCRVGRFVYVSSLGAEAGESAYHRSKRRAEAIVRGFAGGWIILRPGNVYGPGDEIVSRILTMVRTLPLVPVMGSGDDKFQPLWVEDLAAALGECAHRTDLHGRVLEIAGEDKTSLNDLIDRLSEITGRYPARVSIPSFLASAGVTIAGLLGARLPVNESQLTMLGEGNVIRTPGGNALIGVFHVKPTPLDSGLRKLADAQPEQTPDQGVGSLERRRFWVDIAGSRLVAEELFARLRSCFGELSPLAMKMHAEPGTSTILSKGSTLTVSLPVRGNVQLRVEQITPNTATLVTLAGHPLAGAIRFLAEQRGDLLRFEVQVYDRPANLADWVAMRAVGDAVQATSWESLVLAMVVESGGAAVSPVQQDTQYLDEAKAERLEGWVRELIVERKRSQHAMSRSATRPAAQRDGAENDAVL